MIEIDLPAFTDSFQELRTIFPLRGSANEISQVVAQYFAVLRRHPLGLVKAGADAWLAQGTKFPKPAEWLKAIPRSAAAGLLLMPEEEADEYRRAVRLHYEDEPCSCYDCREADVTHRLLRFVPDVDEDDRDVRLRLGKNVVVRGHWAHGAELARWYAARDHYLALKAKYPPKTMGTRSRGRHVQVPVAVMVAQEIKAAIERCEDLERAVADATGEEPPS